MDPQLYYDLRDHIYADFNYMHTNDLGCLEFSGRYPDNLHEEINNYSIVAGVVARQQEFDIIHSHDWLTYPAGIHAKQVSGKPLVIHVHATDFDRSRGNVNPTVYSIEKNGMDHADCIMCVSELTRQTVIHKYYQIRVKSLRSTMPCLRCQKRFRILYRVKIRTRKSLPSWDVSPCRKDRNILLKRLRWYCAVRVTCVSSWQVAVI